MINMQ